MLMSCVFLFFVCFFLLFLFRLCLFQPYRLNSDALDLCVCFGAARHGGSDSFIIISWFRNISKDILYSTQRK